MKRNSTDGENLTNLDNNETKQEQLHLTKTTSASESKNHRVRPQREGKSVPAPDGGMLPVRPPYQSRRNQDRDESQ
jgi:hypothetical protein